MSAADAGARAAEARPAARTDSTSRTPISPVYAASRATFVRGLGLIYALAFASLAVQIRGLVGPDGIRPAGDFLAAAHTALGARAYFRLPTLLWLSNGDAALIALPALGIALGILVLAGRAPRVALAALWLLYLSLSVGGQVFLQFQWDALLLEAGLIAIVYAPRGWNPRWLATEPRPIARWLVWWLSFRLMFLSGITKLLSGDPTWRNLGALDFHYWTQPLPNRIAWHAAQLPAFAQHASVAIMLAIEIGTPLLILAPTRFVKPRRIACALLAALQLGIAATGNYGFFNLLGLLLCLALLDDDALTMMHPRRWAQWKNRRHSQDGASGIPCASRSGIATAMDPGGVEGLRHARNAGSKFTIAVSVMIGLGGLAFAREIIGTAGRAVPRWIDAALAPVAPVSSFNGYGLFRVMTTVRREIVIERSDDGESWTEVEFRYKPGDVMRAPPFVAPHMPRLDWQMWFAALDPQRAAPWLLPLLAHALEATPPVITLFDNPSAGPARFVRLASYRYTFTDRRTRRSTGAWWTREFDGYLTGPLTIDDLRPYRIR